MFTEYSFKRGFGRAKTKEYFVIEKDGDTIGGIVAGPFESELQCWSAIDGLRPLHSRPLVPVGGHLTGWNLAELPEV